MDLPTPIGLTDRDRDLLTVLTQRVRVLSERQVARTYWPDSDDAPAAAARRLEQLSREGLVTRLVMMVHPELDLAGPLVVWQPGLPLPPMTEVSRRARSRWRLPDAATPLVTATSAAGIRFDGHGGRPLRTSEATHDVHLAAVYLRMRIELPTRARSWRSEARLLAEGKGRHEKLPDAMVTDGRAQTAIEFGGSYAADKLTAFHEHCARRGLGYEVW